MRRVLVLVVVIAAAALAWWLLHDDAPKAPAAASPAASPAPTTPPTKPAARTVHRAEAKDATNAPPAPAAENVAASDVGGELLVVDASTGAPLGAVNVGFLPVTPGIPPDAEKAFAKGEDPVDVIVRLGRTFASDAAGKVRLPKLEGVALVGARQGDLRGSTAINSKETPWRLELHRPVALAAQVRDADGGPCGDVGVLLVHHESGDSWPVASARTAAGDGVARFADVTDAATFDAGSMSLTVALPLGDLPSAAVALKPPPAAPVQIVLPPTGRVRCEVVDEQGAPVADGQAVTLRRAGSKDWTPETDRLGVAAATVAAGSALFPYVGLGLELQAEVASADSSRVTVKQFFAGPKAAGEETVVRVTLGGKRPVVVGRLIDRAGAPIARFDVLGGIVETGSGGSDVDRIACTTDEGGRFRFAFDRAPGDAASAKLEIGRTARDANFSSAVRIAIVDLPSVLPPGEIDVGDVTFAGGALLVSGVVVDGAGKPLVGATLRAMDVKGMGASRSPIRDVDAATSDSEGRFRLEGTVETKKVAVGASLGGYYVPGNEWFAVGATDARVVMQPAGGIAGSVRVPGGKNPYDVRILVQGVPSYNGDADYRFRDQALSGSCREGGVFEIDTLRPGKARVALRLGWNDDDTFLVVEGVEIVAGQITRDPRLQDVDPTKSMRALKITVTDAQMKPLADAKVSFRPVGDAGFWKQAGACDAAGVATLAARADKSGSSGFDVIVASRGFHAAVLHGVSADAAVALEAAKPSTVRVRLAESSPLPEPPFQLAATLHWIEPGTPDDEQNWNGPRDVGDEAKFGKDRLLTFETYDPGRYRVDLMLWKMDMNGGGGGSVASAPKTVVVTVGGDGAPEEVVVGVDPEDLKERMSR